MATLTYWTLAKRHNSTKAPTGAGTQVTVNLKGGSDLLTPVFTLNYSGTPSFSYMFFEGRYYFVTGIKNVRQDLWEITGSVDPLATSKADILAMSPYVLYYTHANTEIADKRLSVKTSRSLVVETADFSFLGAGHTYILTVVGKDQICAFNLGAADIDAMFAQDYQNSYDAAVNAIPNVTGIDFADTIIDTVRWWKEYMQSVGGAFNYAGTVAENIKRCIILPMTMGHIGGQPNVRIKLGGVDTGVDAFKVNVRTVDDSVTINIPWQNIADWRRLSPYMEIYLHIPPLGLIALSPSDLIGYTQLTVKMSMDVLSGDTIFQVIAGTHVIYQATTNLATEYAIGSSQTGIQQGANALIGAAGALTGNPLMAAAGVLGLANDLRPTPTCIGSNSGGAVLGLPNMNRVTCYSIFHDTAVTPSSISAEKGTPYNGVLSLANVSGYVQTSGASVSGSMTDTEREMINQLMDGGIYIE